MTRGALLPQRMRSTWFVCIRCGMGYADELMSDDGLCGDLSYLNGQRGHPCDGRLQPREWAPTFTALDTGSVFTFWCKLCRTWHTHSRANGHRIAHCHSEQMEAGYFIVTCGKSPKAAVKAVNLLEWHRWEQAQPFPAMEQAVPSKEEWSTGTMDQYRRKVKLFKSGDSMGVQTTAITVEEFWREFSEVLALVIDSGFARHDWAFQLSSWLPQAFEIAAKLRGYKSEVVEERVLYAGSAFVSDEAEVKVAASAPIESPTESTQLAAV